MRCTFKSLSVAGFNPPALVGRMVKLCAREGLRAGTKGARRLLALIDDVPISTKAFAASSVLLLCLIGLGANAYLSLDRSATGLAHLSGVHLPKQRTASELTGDIITTHLKMFRFVSWAQVGVGRNTLEATSGEVLADLDKLGNRLQLLGAQPNLSPVEFERVTTLSAKWDKYAREMRDVMAAAANDASMASMLLGATDDEFQSIAAELQGIVALVANQTRATSRDLAIGAERNRNILALGGALGVFISVLVALFVGRSIVAPIRAITQAMQGVSSGHGRIDVGYRSRKDEIGQMVEAIAVFQQTMAHQNKLLADRQDELRAQNLRFDAALNHMSQGLAMFDAEQRLVVCNRLYADLYALTPEQVKPGTTIRQLLEYRHATGVFGDVDFETFVRDWLAEFSKASSRIQELADGRVMSIVRRPMPDGGLVSTTEDITQRRRSETRIAHMARHDALTDLPNRVLLKERLELAMARARRDESVAVHLLDLDHFKNVNDTLGHPVGDRLLKAVADRLRTLVRETETIARMGGDEFAIIQVALKQPADASALAQRIVEVVSEPHNFDDHQVVAGTSVGIAVGPTDGMGPDQLIRNADLALYRAKGDGRGVFRFFEPEMDARMQARRTMEYDLRKALVAGEFELHYQPLVNLERNEITGCEALIRWHHPEKGMISPGDFIPLAEENGFIVPLGEWAIRKACSTAATWPEHIRVAVNLSPVQFKNPGLLQVVLGALAASSLQPQRLELEITETVLLDDSSATLATLHQLRALGVRVAMDDFGTGYSSLSYLQSFPFDKIKIDRSFIKELTDKKSAVDIVRAVAALANRLGMATTAEGVETKEQLDTVKAEGCT
jgi:diguanylate cyclase (GGDEF)-like protein